MVLVINLNTTIDKTILINDFAINKIFRPSEVIETGGGKGINVARVLKTLHVQNTVIGFVGGEKTDKILNTLHKEKINFIPVPIHGNSRTCTLIIDKKRCTETIINEIGPKISKIETNNFFKLFHKVFSHKIKYLVISGSQPPGIPNDFYSHLIKYAKNKGVITLLDTSQESFNNAIKSTPDIIKPNQSELMKHLQINKINKSIIKKSLLNFYNSGIKYPVITLGKEGSITINPDTKKLITAIPPEIKKVSTIGCGDAYAAGIIFSLTEHYTHVDTIKVATATASANALKIGAGNLKKKDINKLFNEVNIC